MRTTISNSLHLYLRENKIKQKELSVMSGVSEDTISRFLNGRSINTQCLDKMLSALEVDIYLQKR